MDDKYITFKKEEWDKFWAEKGGDVSELNELALDDSVVIRRRDIFAPPALDAYSNAILTSVALMVPGETRDRLSSIARYFHEQAVLSWDTHRKVPD